MVIKIFNTQKVDRHLLYSVTVMWLKHSHFRPFCFTSLPRRIHISRATLDCLEGTYKTEDGHGRDRNEFLLKYNIDTFLICPNEEPQNADLHRPPKVHKTHQCGNQEMQFGNTIDMNSVGATKTRS